MWNSYGQATHDFSGVTDGDLVFKRGDIIQLLSGSVSGWCEGKVVVLSKDSMSANHLAQVGRVPRNYIMLLTKPPPSEIITEASAPKRALPVTPHTVLKTGKKGTPPKKDFPERRRVQQWQAAFKEALKLHKTTPGVRAYELLILRGKRGEMPRRGENNQAFNYIFGLLQSTKLNEGCSDVVKELLSLKFSFSNPQKKKLNKECERLTGSDFFAIPPKRHRVRQRTHSGGPRQQLAPPRRRVRQRTHSGNKRRGQSGVQDLLAPNPKRQCAILTGSASFVLRKP